MIEAVLGVGIPFASKPRHEQFAAEMERLTPRVSGIRRLGAAAVDMAYVACGRFDAYWEQSVSAWDIAAGVVIVEEAGGVVTDTLGRPLRSRQWHRAGFGAAASSAVGRRDRAGRWLSRRVIDRDQRSGRCRCCLARRRQAQSRISRRPGFPPDYLRLVKARRCLRHGPQAAGLRTDRSRR